VRGARRALCVPFELHQIEAAPPEGELLAGYTVEFTLPSGSYATALLREFMSPDSGSKMAASDAAITES
jgi:tRNA(Glu) U13 pseudouridine synthase TruD